MYLKIFEKKGINVAIRVKLLLNNSFIFLEILIKIFYIINNKTVRRNLIFMKYCLMNILHENKV